MTTSDKPRFSLRWWAYLCLAIAFVLEVAALAAAPKATTSYESSHYIGELIGLILWPLLVAWIVFRLTHRRELVASIVFVVILALAFFGTIAANDRTAKYKQQLNELDQALADRRSRTIDEVRNEDAAKGIGEVSSKFRAVAEHAPARDARAIEAGAELMDELAAAMRKYQDALQKLSATSPLVTPPVRLEQLAAFRSAATEFRRENNAVRQFVAQVRVKAAMVANARGLDGQSRSEFLDALDSGFGQQQPALLTMRDQDDKMVDLLISIANLLEEQTGKWQHDGQVFVFADEKVVPQFNALCERINTLANEQDTLQREHLKKLQR